MPYATVQDLVDRFGERELIQLTDPDLVAVRASKVELAILDAQAFADSYVGVAYRLPLAGCAKPAPTVEEPAAIVMVPAPQLVRITCDVARYYLHDDLAPEHEVAQRYKAAERELVAISAGKAMLSCPWGGAPGVPVAGGDAPGEGQVFYGFSPRQITDDSTRGYA